MTSTPAITTTHLLLRPFADDHLTSQYVGWLNDPETVRFSELRHRKHNLKDCRSHIEGLREGGHHFWAIEQQGSPQPHIGNVTAYMDRANNSAEVSILVGSATSRGQGLGSEAWCAVVDHLIEVENVRLVHAGTMSVNSGMLRIFEKSGMSVEGESHEYFLLDGVPVDLVRASRHANPVSANI